MLCKWHYQWARDSTKLVEQSNITLTFPINYAYILQVGCFGFANGLSGGTYQCAGVYSYTTSKCNIVGGDNGYGYRLILAIGY